MGINEVDTEHVVRVTRSLDFVRQYCRRRPSGPLTFLRAVLRAAVLWELRPILDDGSARNPIPTGVREVVYARHGGRCWMCGDPVGEVGHLDHLIPRSVGGPDDPFNLFLACGACNASKRDEIRNDAVRWAMCSLGADIDFPGEER